MKSLLLSKGFDYKRKFKLLEDPRAKDIFSRLNGLYVLDHKREELAEEDYINGQEWTIEDHLRWRKENLLLEFNSIVNDNSSSKIDSSTSKEQPISKALKSAIKYAITESDAIRRIFKSDRLCFLDFNQIEICNRYFGYHRRTSQAFGSIKSAENLAVFISLIESAKKHNLNLNEYMTFLFEQMAKADNRIVTNKDSEVFHLYRAMLPDKYAETHIKEVPTYEAPPEIQKPLNPNSKRLAYKKRRGPIDSSNNICNIGNP